MNFVGARNGLNGCRTVAEEFAHRIHRSRMRGSINRRARHWRREGSCRTLRPKGVLHDQKRHHGSGDQGRNSKPAMKRTRTQRQTTLCERKFYREREMVHIPTSSVNHAFEICLGSIILPVRSISSTALASQIFAGQNARRGVTYATIMREPVSVS